MPEGYPPGASMALYPSTIVVSKYVCDVCDLSKTYRVSYAYIEQLPKTMGPCPNEEVGTPCVGDLMLVEAGYARNKDGSLAEPKE